MDFDLESRTYRVPEWLDETGCLNVLDFDKFILVNAYFPYANNAQEEFIKIRHRWDYEINEYLESLARRKPLIVCGALNMVSEDIDTWDGVSEKKAGCFYDWEHRNFESMLKAAGLVDSYRVLLETLLKAYFI